MIHDCLLKARYFVERGSWDDENVCAMPRKVLQLIHVERYFQFVDNCQEVKLSLQNTE